MTSTAPRSRDEATRDALRQARIVANRVSFSSGTRREVNRALDTLENQLGRNQPKAERKPKSPKADRKAEAKAREEARELRKAIAAAEAASARLSAHCSALDLAMFDPAGAEPELASLPMTELSRRRAKAAAELEEAEAHWLSVSEQLEQLAA